MHFLHFGPLAKKQIDQNCTYQKTLQTIFQKAIETLQNRTAPQKTPYLDQNIPLTSLPFYRKSEKVGIHAYSTRSF